MTEQEAEKLLSLIDDLEQAAARVATEDSRGGDKDADDDLVVTRNAVNNYVLSLLK